MACFVARYARYKPRYTEALPLVHAHVAHASFCVVSFAFDAHCQLVKCCFVVVSLILLCCWVLAYFPGNGGASKVAPQACRGRQAHPAGMCGPPSVLCPPAGAPCHDHTSLEAAWCSSCYVRVSSYHRVIEAPTRDKAAAVCVCAIMLLSSNGELAADYASDGSDDDGARRRHEQERLETVVLRATIPMCRARSCRDLRLGERIVTSCS
jgi:hypothetical protein